MFLPLTICHQRSAIRTMTAYVAAALGDDEDGVVDGVALRADLPASRMSCFFILLYRVGRYSPRICAASCLFQFVRCSVCRIAIFSISASVRCGGMTKSVDAVDSSRIDSGRSVTAI